MIAELVRIIDGDEYTYGVYDLERPGNLRALCCAVAESEKADGIDWKVKEVAD